MSDSRQSNWEISQNHMLGRWSSIKGRQPQCEIVNREYKHFDYEDNKENLLNLIGKALVDVLKPHIQMRSFYRSEITKHEYDYVNISDPICAKVIQGRIDLFDMYEDEIASLKKKVEDLKKDLHETEQKLYAYTLHIENLGVKSK